LGAIVCWTSSQLVSSFIWWAAHQPTKKNPRICPQAKWTLSDTRSFWFLHFRAFWHRRLCCHTQLRSTQNQKRTYQKKKETRCNNNWWYEKIRKMYKVEKRGEFYSFWYLCFLFVTSRFIIIWISVDSIFYCWFCLFACFIDIHWYLL
jgi:hypothetical protein